GYNLLANGTWVVVSGSGSAQGTKVSDWSDDSSGTYSYPVASGAVTGTWDDHSHEHSETDTTNDWTLQANNTWLTTGTSDNTTTGGFSSSYDGSGSYVVGGGDPSNWMTGTGTITESGSDAWSYNYGSSYDLNPD